MIASPQGLGLIIKINSGIREGSFDNNITPVRPMALGIRPPLAAPMVRAMPPSLSRPGVQRPEPCVISMMMLRRTRKRREMGKTARLAIRLVIQEEKPILMPGKEPIPM